MPVHPQTMRVKKHTESLTITGQAGGPQRFITLWR
jgi:hypothetical protein